jgi:hypothetical protein
MSKAGSFLHTFRSMTASNTLANRWIRTSTRVTWMAGPRLSRQRVVTGHFSAFLPFFFVTFANSSSTAPEEVLPSSDTQCKVLQSTVSTK